METLIMLTYSFFCWLVFKVFKVPVTKWTLTTAVLGGMALIAAIIVLMNYNHPYTTNARQYFVSTPMITNVSGVVDKVYVTEQMNVKEGDTLYTLDPTNMQSAVDNLKASKVSQEAKIRSYEAALSLSRTRLRESKALLKARAGSAYDVEMYEAQIDQTQANIEATEAQILQTEAQLEQANFNLESCYVLAPSDGLVSQVAVRPGMRSVQFPLRPLMSFVSTDQFYVVAALPQNPMQRVKVGDEVDIIFDAIPGTTIFGEVYRIGDVISQGEIQAQGTLNNLDNPALHVQGSVPVFVKITSDVSGYFIPGGAKAQVAVYTEYMEPMKIVRKVLLRMKSWQNYLFGEH